MSAALGDLNKIHERRVGSNTDLPDAGTVGMHRLEDRVAMGDNASTAQKCIRVEAAALVKDACKTHMGQEKWNSLTPEQQAASGKLYGANCHRHLGNTWIDGGAKSEMKYLDTIISDEEINKARFLRCTTDVNKLIHAYSKGLGEGQNRYGKGFGEQKRALLEEKHGNALYQTVQRTDKGTRMDACTEAAMDMYINRKYDVDSLKIAVYSKSNVLRDNLLVMLSSRPVIGCLRARGIINDKFTIRHRWFSAATVLDGWSALDMAPVTDCSRDMFVLLTQDHEVVVTPEYDAYESFLATTPAYVDFLEKLDSSTKRSVDGKSVIYDMREVRKELYTPADPDNAACSDITSSALEAWGRGLLERLDNGRGKTYCRDGDYGVDKQPPPTKNGICRHIQELQQR